MKSLLKGILITAALLVGIVVGVNHFSDWQVLLVRNGVKLLDAPSVGDPAERYQSETDHGVTPFHLEVISDQLELPWSVALLSEQQALITERSGKLFLIDLNSGAKSEITGLPDVFYKGQGGLFDVAPHPDFENNQLLYLTYAVALPGQNKADIANATTTATASSEKDKSSTRLARAKLDLTSLTLSDWQTLYTCSPALDTTRHYGGRLLFNDEFLYMTMGERGNRQYAPELDNDLGKVLRFTHEGGIPEDNPFVDTQHNPAIYSYGHRNPQGLTLRPGSDEIWVSEHGPQGGDEINLIKAGANYGWPTVSYGEEYGGGKIGEGGEKEGIENPLHHYIPSIATGNLAFYSGAAFPYWQGDLFVTGLRSFDLSRLSVSQTAEKLTVTGDERLLDNIQLRLRDIKIDELGQILLLSENGSLAIIKPIN